MSANKKGQEFQESLDEAFQKVQTDSHFDVAKFKKSFAGMFDDKELSLKEMEHLVDFHKVPIEEMGEEMDDPCMEACFICDALFEKNQGVAIKIPFCGHRAHIECIRRVQTGYCTICGNGIRSSLYSLIKSKKQTEEAKNQALAQGDGDDLDINVPHLGDNSQL